MSAVLYLILISHQVVIQAYDFLHVTLDKWCTVASETFKYAVRGWHVNTRAQPEWWHYNQWTTYL